MSETPEDPDACGCCAPTDAPDAIHNAPGLSALAYRIGTFEQFRARMLRTLASARPHADSTGAPPLQSLTVRTPDDPTIALVDAFAQVADVLTFYQERIANEGFLRTATERRSVLELARAIGYELGPGVAAGVHVAFTIEEAPGAPRRAVVAKGTQLQSVPPQAKAPQVFETTTEFTALADWNRLRPRLTRPADVALLVGASGADDRLVLLVPAGSAPPEDVAAANVTAPDVRRLGAGEFGTESLDAVEIGRIYLTEAANTLTKGDLILFAGGASSERRTLIRRISAVVTEPARKRVRVDVEPLGAPATVKTSLPYRFVPIATLASVKLAPLTFNGATVGSTVRANAWRERDLTALMGIHAWSGADLQVAVNTTPAPLAAPPRAGAFSFRTKLGFFGNNAPKWSALPKNGSAINGSPYPAAWDKDDAAAGSPASSRTIWETSQGAPHRNDGVDAYLERPVSGIAPSSWIVVGSNTVQHQAWVIHDAQDTSRADFGISGRATALRLADPVTELELTSAPANSAYPFRGATAHVGSEALTFVELPIEAPVAAGTRELELDTLVLGLSPGQPIALVGERSDTPGVEAAELATLQDVIHSHGRTVLALAEGLEFSYVRDALTICANVVHATHGETVREVLGSGDASQPNQRFTLSRRPLTYTSAATATGLQGTLEVRVNDVLWDEVPSLYGLPASATAYVVRIDDDGRAHVTFGDGTFGARLPTGTANVKARYRTGTGADGEVAAGTLTVLRTMPLGVRGVTNPLPAGGAEDPERLDDARRNAPLTVLTFDRVVSLVDFEDYARTFPGIGKARATVLWIDGTSAIHLTVAGATGGAADAGVVANLIGAIAAASDGSQRVLVDTYAPRLFTCRARVAVDPRYERDAVLAAVVDAVRDAFDFASRQLAQPVTPAEVLARIHDVPGVVAVDLDALAPYSESGAEIAAARPAPLVAQPANWDAAARRAQPAELLLVNPVGIEITDMSA